MLTKEQFCEKLVHGHLLMDGATGSNLMKVGMPRGCCAEAWILENPQPLMQLQRQYAEAGSQIIYAPTFQAQPLALERAGLAKQTEKINARLVSLSRKAAPHALIAGDLATMAAVCDSWNPELFDTLVENYRRQIRGLLDGGADLLVAETLLYPQEAEAALTAAALENAGALLCSFTMQPDGSLFSGMEAGPILAELEKAGVAAVGFNCVPASNLIPGLVSKLRRFTRLPLLCKPNAGNPIINENGIAQYSMEAPQFAQIMGSCKEMGASLLGGCCGTDPSFIAALKALP